LLRLPEFAIGICVAELHFRNAMVRVPSWAVATTLVTVLCLTNDPHVGPFVTAMSALLIASVSANQDTRFARLLSMRWLVIMGGASYSLYLLQQPIHFAVKNWLGTDKAVIAVHYPILIVASVAVFMFYEEPMREWIRSRGRMKSSAMEQVVDKPSEEARLHPSSAIE
jgi:peptidoglycan/LPS O-acetylase OafA/YrhL